MGLERRANLKCLGFARKVPKSDQMPSVAIGVRYRQFIPRDVEGSALPSICRFYFDQSIFPVRFKA